MASGITLENINGGTVSLQYSGTSTGDKVLTIPESTDTLVTQTDIANKITLAQANAYDIGVNQTWQDLSASRLLGTIYTNSPGKSILVNVGAYSAVSGQTAVLRAIINSIVVYFSSDNNATYTGLPFGNLIVPPGATYQIDVVRWDTKTVSNGSLQYWSELR